MSIPLTAYMRQSYNCARVSSIMFYECITYSLYKPVRQLCDVSSIVVHERTTYTLYIYHSDNHVYVNDDMPHEWPTYCLYMPIMWLYIYQVV